ncbi:MAG: hypothetical protein HC915_20940, partial [Anaerolineae bacterium]|nr:hypothetical protein [Anaerolineae bacterium]
MKTRAALLFLLLVYGALASFYATLTPVFEKPDEYLHFAFAMHLHETGQLPVQRAGELDHLAAQQGSQPPLYYGSLVLLWQLVGMREPGAGFQAQLAYNPHYNHTPSPWPDNENQFLRGRCDSACQKRAARPSGGGRWGHAFGALTLLAAFAAVRIAFPTRPNLALLSVLALSANPQFLHIATAVSNDIS